MHSLITHNIFAVAPDFKLSKCVCKSQNRKCVCKSQNTIRNVSVSHKIENVSVNHEIIIYRVFLRGADRGVLTMVCNGPYWCLVDYMYRKLSWNLVKNRRKQAKGYFVTFRHFCVTYRHLRNLVQGPVFPPSQFEQILCFLL